MAEVIRLETRKGKDKLQANQQGQGMRSLERATGEGCKSPIITKRLSKLAISLFLNERFYNLPLIEGALFDLPYGDVWSLRKVANKKSSMYAEYIVELERNFGEDTDQVLVTIVSRIIERVYMEEVCIWTDGVEVAELTRPHHYSLWDGTSISTKTASLLADHGIRSVRDLIVKTREELCQVPGMTTSEMVKLEKSLASRGLFLKTRINCF